MKRFWSCLSGSLAGNTRNKSASFSYLDMGTRPLFQVLSTLQTLDYRVPKNILSNPCRFILDNKSGPLNKYAASLKYMKPNGRGIDFETASFVRFVQNVAF